MGFSALSPPTKCSSRIVPDRAANSTALFFRRSSLPLSPLHDLLLHFYAWIRKKTNRFSEKVSEKLKNEHELRQERITRLQESLELTQKRGNQEKQAAYEAWQRAEQEKKIRRNAKYIANKKARVGSSGGFHAPKKSWS